MIAFFLAALIFVYVSEFFIEEKSVLGKMWATGAGFFGGMVCGGVVGWLVGGFGVVAMGTGVGVGALGAIAVGAIAGAILGGLTGASFSLLQMVLSPGDYDVHWLGLALVLLLAVGLFFILRRALNKVVTIALRDAKKALRRISHEHSRRSRDRHMCRRDRRCSCGAVLGAAWPRCRA